MKTTTTTKTTKKQKRGKRENWPIGYRWAAAGILVAYSATGTKMISVAHAQEAYQAAPAQTLPVALSTPAAQAGAISGRLPLWKFDIPAEPLEEARKAFEQTTGLKVELAKEQMGSIVSAYVSGEYTSEQALRRLLVGTGLAFRFASSSKVIIDVTSVSTSVEVVGGIDPLATASPKFAEAPLDAARTITAVPRALMQEQGVTTLRDALRDVAGISLAAGEGGAQGDNLTIRGFTARNDLFIDAMRDFGSYYRDPFDMQEVEVLQGPSSVTFGRGSTGGVVNQATKLPGMDRFWAGDFQVGTDRTRRLTLDWNQPVHLLGNNSAFRLNVMGDEGGVAERDIAENRRFGIAPSLALGLGTSTRLSFNYFHQNADDNPDYGIPWLFNQPAPVPRTNYYGFQNGNFLRTYDDIGTVKVEHDAGKHFTLRDQVRYANYVRDAQITEAQIPAGTLATTPLNAISINRNQITVNSVETFLDEQLDVIGHFDWLGLRHSLVAGIEGGRETSDPTRLTWTGVPTTSLLSPNPYQPFAGSAAISSRVRTDSTTAGAYALDSVQIGKHWNVAGGVRWDRFNTHYDQSVGTEASYRRIDEMPSWRASVVYKPVQVGSIYFDAGTSFNPSAESLSLSASTASLPPEKNRTYEFGTKWDLPHSRLSLRAAVFQTTKLNAREPDPTNSLLNVLAGNQRVNGAEIDVHMRVTSRWDFQSGYANLDGTVVSSNYYPLSIGARLANVPRHTLNFWNLFRLPKRWESGVGGNFVSSRTASSTAPYDATTGLLKEVPGYWVFNAMVKHPLTEYLDFQVNVSNIANRYYYDQLHPAHIVPGAGRSALVGLHFKF
jgi:catecholate siderophore receptor